MSRGGDTRFAKGISGNPKGRPKLRRPHVSAFDIIFDKTLTVTQGAIERELTVDEALQLQTYQAALKGSRMAVRQILRMIEKRELAIAALSPPAPAPVAMQIEHNSDNADEALRLLGILVDAEGGSGAGHFTRPLRLATWAVQAALSRPGRRRHEDKDVKNIELFTLEPQKLKWPRQRSR